MGAKVADGVRVYDFEQFRVVGSKWTNKLGKNLKKGGVFFSKKVAKTNPKCSFFCDNISRLSHFFFFFR